MPRIGARFDRVNWRSKGGMEVEGKAGSLRSVGRKMGNGRAELVAG